MKNYRNVLVAIAVVFSIMAVLRFSSPEDTWICQNGAWVKHGVPNAPMPNEICQK